LFDENIKVKKYFYEFLTLGLNGSRWWLSNFFHLSPFEEHPVLSG
jgi:hypothetical protein